MASPKSEGVLSRGIGLNDSEVSGQGRPPISMTRRRPNSVNLSWRVYRGRCPADKFMGVPGKTARFLNSGDEETRRMPPKSTKWPEPTKPFGEADRKRRAKAEAFLVSTSRSGRPVSESSHPIGPGFSPDRISWETS